MTTKRFKLYGAHFLLNHGNFITLMFSNAGWFLFCPISKPDIFNQWAFLESSQSCHLTVWREAARGHSPPLRKLHQVSFKRRLGSLSLNWESMYFLWSVFSVLNVWSVCHTVWSVWGVWSLESVHWLCWLFLMYGVGWVCWVCWVCWVSVVSGFCGVCEGSGVWRACGVH